MKKDKKVSKWLRIALPTAVIAVWFVIAAIGGPYFGKVGEVSSLDLTAFLPASSEATKVQKQLTDFREDDVIPAIIVFERGGGITKADTTFASSFGEDLAGQEGIKGDPSPPIVSEDKKASLVVANIDAEAEIGDVVNAVSEKLDKQAPNGLAHYITGPAGFSSDLNKAFSGIDGLLLGVALAVVFAILLAVYRSPLLPFIVLFTSMFALTASILLVWNLANNDIVELNGQVQGILFILVIGAATDYSLLFVSRYKEELRHHQEAWQAIKSAWKSSIEPIAASGGTVIVGLLCLLVSDLNSNKALGPVGAIGIGFSVVSALTLLPSLLLLFGRASFWPFRPKFNSKKVIIPAVSAKGAWPAVARFVAAQPRKIWITLCVLLIVGAIGAMQFKATGISQSDLILGESSARDGQDLIGKHFPDGSGSPAVIIGNVDKQADLVKAIEIDGVDTVSAIANNSPSGSIPLGSDLPAFNPFIAIEPTVVNNNIALQAVLTNAPDSAEAEQTVIALRESVKKVDQNAIVGGPTATSLDTNTASIRDRNVIIPIVLVAITIILMLLLRAVVAPILLILTTVISFGTALGVSALLFNGVFNFPGADPSVPLFGFVFLVALGIDYNIFLMTRVREEAIKHGTKEGVLRGLIVTGGVITSAGVVLAATFAALAVIPILFLAQLAFIVAFGVLLDALIVRSLFVPALIHDIGPKVWWPSKLSKSKD